MTAKDSPEARAGRIFVSRQFKRSGNDWADEEESKNETLEVRLFSAPPAHVSVKYGLTVNLGNYEAARVDAGVTLPCYPEEVKEAFNTAWRIAEAELQSQVSDLKKGRR